MSAHQSRPARDDEPAVMTMDERASWVQLIFTVVTSVGYVVAVAPQVVDGHVEDINWVPPMLWAIGISIIGVILGSIMAGIGGAIGLTIRGRDVDAELASDYRDKEIEGHSRLKTYWMLMLTLVGVLILAMIDADTFWIATFMFVALSIQTVVAQIIKIRAYRRGV